MAPGDQITQDWQIEINGLVLGGDSPYVIRSFEPRTAPVSRQATLPRAQRHGVIAGRDLLGSRLVPFSVYIEGNGTTDAEDRAALDDLAAAMAPRIDNTTLVWQEEGVQYRLEGRPAPIDSRIGPHLPADCRFEATDPYIYANLEQHGETEYPDPTDVYPDVYAPYLDPLTNGRVLLNNEGTSAAPWRAQVTGPWASPIIQLIDPADPFPIIQHTLELDVALGADDSIYVDSDRELVYVNGTVRLELSTLDLDWFTIPRGQWALRFAGGPGTGTAEAWARSVWL